MKKLEQFIPSEEEDRKLVESWNPKTCCFSDENKMNEGEKQKKKELVYQ